MMYESWALTTAFHIRTIECFSESLARPFSKRKVKSSGDLYVLDRSDGPDHRCSFIRRLERFQRRTEAVETGDHHSDRSHAHVAVSAVRWCWDE